MSSGTALTEEQVGSFGTGVDRSPSALPLILAGSREGPGSRSFQGCVSEGGARSAPAGIIGCAGGLGISCCVFRVEAWPWGHYQVVQLVGLAWRDKVL